jgi:hypothetical protein
MTGATPPTITKLDLARFAARTLGLRLREADAGSRAGKWSNDHANNGVAVWRAIALLCGSDVSHDPDLAEALADERIVQVYPGDGTGPWPRTVDESEARALLADRWCGRDRWSRWLEKATRKAEAAADASQAEADITHARMLQALGHRLDCLAPYIPRAPLPNEAALFTPENAE